MALGLPTTDSEGCSTLPSEGYAVSCCPVTCCRARASLGSVAWEGGRITDV